VDVKVKICGLTNSADAEAAVQAGADALGLMFYAGSPRHISIEEGQAIAATLPPYVIRVGVFVDPNPSDVFAAIQCCGLNVLQFHGAETSEFCAQFGIITLKAFRLADAESLRPMEGFGADAFLLDSYVAGVTGGTGRTFNWDLAVQAKQFGRPIFLAGGLTAENAAEAVRKVQPFAVDVSSGVEASPGKKDVKKMQDFIAAVRGA
jgi:phosphoribosylanthranilate isomerase